MKFGTICGEAMVTLQRFSREHPTGLSLSLIHRVPPCVVKGDDDHDQFTCIGELCYVAFVSPKQSRDCKHMVRNSKNIFYRMVPLYLLDKLGALS